MGVASQSHKAIHNLLDEVERAAGEEGLDFQGLKQGQEYDGRFIRTGRRRTSSPTPSSR